MISTDKRNRINFTVREGSALERYLAATTTKTAGDALHELAAQFSTRIGTINPELTAAMARPFNPQPTDQSQ